jgi:hypothetical protein
MKAWKARTLVAAVAIVASLAGCQITWELEKTHGVIVEPGAVRASVGIWREPTRVLYDIYRNDSLETVKYLLCYSGNFPVPSVHVGSYGITANVLQPKWCGYVYGDDNDLRGALTDAQSGSADDCLALTLISSGAYIKNWTHKSGGCKQGSI